MKYLIKLVSALSVIIIGIQVSLNTWAKQEYSFEKSIKLILTMFNENPFYTILVGFCIIFIGLFTSYIIEKYYFNLFDPEHKKNKLELSISKVEKRTKNRDAFFEKVFIKSQNKEDYKRLPYERITGLYSRLLIKNIESKDISDYSRYEVFNFTEEGIEFFDGRNTIGFDLLINKNGEWDVLDRFDKRKKDKELKKVIYAYSVVLVPYEYIEHIDWDIDPREGYISIYCNYKFYFWRYFPILHKAPSPFKETRLYYKTDFGVMRFEENTRKNFKRFDILKPLRIYFVQLNNTIFRLKNDWRVKKGRY